MWITFGTGSEYRRKKDGRCLHQQCPQCNQFANFYEMEKVDYISVFFVPILSHAKETDPTHNPPFECEKCGRTFIIKINQQTTNNNKTTNKSKVSETTDWLKSFFKPKDFTPEELAKAEAKKRAENMAREKAKEEERKAQEMVRKAQEEKRKAQDIEDALQRLKKDMQNNQKK